MKLKELKKYIQLRYFIVLILGLGTYSLMSQRIGFATNLLCMNQEGNSFNYSIKVRSDLQSYFYIGYAVAQIPLSIIFKVYGVKYTVSVIFFIFSLITFLTPFVAESSIQGFYISRLISGLTAACWFPSVFNVLPKWIPPFELNIMQAFIYSGMHIAAITAPFLTQQLCETQYSWKSPFYFFGSFGGVYSFVYLIFIYDNPFKCWAMSENEKTYLKGKITSPTKKKPIELKKLLTCVPLWVSAFCQFCLDWGSYLLYTSAANYLQDFFNYSIEWNSLIQGLTMLGLWGGQTFFTLIVALLIKKTKLSLIQIRKLMTGLGFILPSAILFIICMLNKNQGTLAVVFLTLSCFFTSAVYLGSMMTVFDCTPSNSGEIFAVMNSISAISGYLAPWLLGLLVEKYGDYGWQYSFAINASLYVFAGMLFLIFGKAELQPWELTEFLTESI